MDNDLGKERSIKSLAFSRFKRNFPNSWPLALAFGLVVIPSLILGAFFPASLFFLVPFIIMPTFLSLTISLCDGHKERDISSRKSFAYFFSYFRTPFYGSYCFWPNAIISFFFAFLAELIAYFIFNPIFSNAFIDFSANLSGVLLEISQYRDYAGAYKMIRSNETLSLFFELIALIGAITFSLILIFRLSSYALNPFLRAHLGGAPRRVLNEIYLGGLKKARPGYSRDYRSSLFPIFLIFFFFFAAGVAIGWLLLRRYLSPVGIVAFAFALGLFALLPFLSYYVYALDFLFRKYSFSFLSYSLAMMQNDYKRFISEMSEEEKKEIDKHIEKTKQERDDLLKKSQKLEDNDEADYIYLDEDDNDSD